MGRRTLFLLLLVFVALAGLTFYQTRQDAAAPETSDDIAWDRVFPELTVLNIGAIRILHPDSGIEFTIARAADGTWTAPGREGTLNADAATAIARTVVLLPFERTLPLATETPLAQFGFIPNGSLFIIVSLINGGSHTIAVGGQDTSGTAYYGLVDESTTAMYVLGREPIDFLYSMLVEPPIVPLVTAEATEAAP